MKIGRNQPCPCDGGREYKHCHGSLRLIQDYLGHRDPRHTVHYTRTAGRRLEGRGDERGPGHDLGGIIKWSAREDWRPGVDAVMTEHFKSALKEFGIAFEAIDNVFGGVWTLTLRGCAFEDFLTRRFGPDNVNPVKVYIRVAAGKSLWRREYMMAL